MHMKKILLYCVAAILLFTASCSKEGPKWFEGSWSFKTSGSMTVAVKDSVGMVTSVIPVSLVTESGQMHVVRKDRDGNMLVTMNAIGGDVTVYEAVASGKELSFGASGRRLSMNLGDMTLVHPNVVSTGVGERFDDVLVVRFSYTGEVRLGNTVYEIVGSDVECVATLNK